MKKFPKFKLFLMLKSFQNYQIIPQNATTAITQTEKCNFIANDKKGRAKTVPPSSNKLHKANMEN